MNMARRQPTGLVSESLVPGTRVRRSLVLAGLAAALMLSGCSAGNSDDAADTAGKAKPPARADVVAEQDAAAGARGSAELGKLDQGKLAQGGAAQSKPDQAKPDQGKPVPGGQAAAPVRHPVDERLIIFTGSITLRVPDVDTAAAKAAAIATGSGGFVGADKRTSDDKRSEAVLELRVPSARFADAVDDVSKLGKQESRDINTDDVTEQVTDINARIASQEASVARTRAMLAQAKTIGELTSVEAELAKRESELASLQARKRKLDDLTTLSTITVVLLGPEPAAPAADTEDDDKEEIGFLSGLSTGWNGLLGAVLVLVTVLGFLLPFAIVAAVPLVVWRVLRVRRRRAATSRATASATPAPVSETVLTQAESSAASAV